LNPGCKRRIGIGRVFPQPIGESGGSLYLGSRNPWSGTAKKKLEDRNQSDRRPATNKISKVCVYGSPTSDEGQTIKLQGWNAETGTCLKNVSRNLRNKNFSLEETGERVVQGRRRPL